MMNSRPTAVSWRSFQFSLVVTAASQRLTACRYSAGVIAPFENRENGECRIRGDVRSATAVLHAFGAVLRTPGPICALMVRHQFKSRGKVVGTCGVGLLQCKDVAQRVRVPRADIGGGT